MSLQKSKQNPLIERRFPWEGTGPHSGGSVLLDPTTGRFTVRKVNVDGEAYECAVAYMIRLEREDFDDAKQLAKLGAVVKMTPEEFRARFGYLCGVK